MKRFLSAILCLALIAPVALAQRSGGSSGARSSPSPSASRPKFSSSSGASSRPSFSGSSKPSTTPGASQPTFSGGSASKPSAAVGSKPSASYDSHAASAQRRAESRASMPRAAAPKTSYKTATGKHYVIPPDAPAVTKMRTNLSHDDWANRSVRQHTVYHHYYDRPAVHYHDPYGSLFWYWMLDQSLDRQAAWAYHHRTTMDPARYQELVGKNKELEGRIKELERQGVRADETFAPDGIDPDLQYSDEYVDAVVNPQEGGAETAASAGSGPGVFVLGLILGTLAAVVIAVIIRCYDQIR